MLPSSFWWYPVLVVIKEDAVGRAFQVVKLIIAYRPDEYPDGYAKQDQ